MEKPNQLKTRSSAYYDKTLQETLTHKAEAELVELRKLKNFKFSQIYWEISKCTAETVK